MRNIDEKNIEEKEDKLIKIRACHIRDNFPRYPARLGVGDDTFGITIWEVLESLEGEVEENSRGQVTVTGEFTSPIDDGKVYTILAKEKIHPQYGVQYELLYINEEVDLKKLNNQKAFLKTFLTDGQIEEMYKIYEDPLEVIADHDIEGLKKVHGVGDYIANCIITRFEENKDMSKVYIELNDYGLTPNFIQKLIKRYKNPNTLIDMVKNNPYQLTYDMDGIGFLTADKIALKGGISEKSVERVKAYIKYYLQCEGEDGNSYVTAGELLANIYNAFDGKENISENYYDSDGNLVGTNIGRAIDELSEKGIIKVEDGENKSRRRIYLTEYWELENQISNHLKRLMKSGNHFNYGNWREKIEKLEEKQGFKFAKEQLDGIKLGLDSQVCLISGLAGSGKSSLVSGILASLDDYSFAQCALSGKAAARLQEVTGQSGSTIHRLLAYNPGTGFMYNENNPLPYDIIVLDEISLVGGYIFLSLIRAIRDGCKLIMLGDMGQLESIGALNLAYDIYNSETVPTVELKEVHRQAAQSGIITTAHTVRNQIQLFEENNYEGTQVLGELKDMILDVQIDKDKIRETAINYFKEFYESELVEKDIMKIQLISPVKERGDSCVFNLNADVQSIINPISESKKNIKIKLSKDKSFYIQEGDKVMCIKNNYRTNDLRGGNCPIFNGWVGIVTNILDSGVIVDFPLAGGEVFLSIKDAREQLVLGYASTVHKLQGSDSPVVIGVIDYSTPPSMLTNSLLYTLITRAKKRCILVGQSGAIKRAISTNYVSTKRTFLQELLDGEQE